MTQEQIQAEWEYVRLERIGIMCEDNDPTPRQKWIAIQEANQALLVLAATDDDAGE